MLTKSEENWKRQNQRRRHDRSPPPSSLVWHCRMCLLVLLSVLQLSASWSSTQTFLKNNRNEVLTLTGHRFHDSQSQLPLPSSSSFDRQRLGRRRPLPSLLLKRTPNDVRHDNDNDNIDESYGGDTDATASRNATGDDRRRFLSKVAIALAAVSSPWKVHKERDAAFAYFDPEEAQRIAIFEKTSPAVVFIDTFTERQDVFSTDVMEVPLGSGSGFVWDRDGHIVTNYHVVQKARKAQVAILSSEKQPQKRSKNKTNGEINNNNNNKIGSQLASDSSPSINGNANSQPSYTSRPAINGVGERSVFQATVVGVDPAKDIAVLKVNASQDLLKPINVGTSGGLKVGQRTLAIGNPFGLDHTLTAGIISGIGRQVRSPTGRPISSVIQTDAAINPGNSGGPLLDSSGKLIGVNTAIYSPSGGSAGVGFALPVDTVRVIVETLIRDGQVVRPLLGISYLESKQAKALGIGSGVLVLEVPKGSPADLAGLRGTRRTETGLIEVGDIISKIGKKVINTESDLFTALEEYQPGQSVSVTVSRIGAGENDELQTKDIIVNIVLQSSVDVEKKMNAQLQEQFQQKPMQPMLPPDSNTPLPPRQSQPYVPLPPQHPNVPLPNTTPSSLRNSNLNMEPIVPDYVDPPPLFTNNFPNVC